MQLKKHGGTCSSIILMNPISPCLEVMSRMHVYFLSILPRES